MKTFERFIKTSDHQQIEVDEKEYSSELVDGYFYALEKLPNLYIRMSSLHLKNHYIYIMDKNEFQITNLYFIYENGRLLHRTLIKDDTTWNKKGIYTKEKNETIYFPSIKIAIDYIANPTENQQYKTLSDDFEMFENRQITKDKYTFNKPLFKIAKKLAEKLEYKLIRYLGRGSYGYAFLLNDNKVLKITSDKREINYLKNNLHKECDCLVKYYHMIKIPYNLIKNESYALVMDYVTPLSKIQKNIISDLFIEYNFYGEILSGNYQESEKELEKFLKEKGYNLNSSMRFVKRLSDFSRCLSNNGILDIYEAHIYNIGWKNDNLVYYDIAG